MEAQLSNCTKLSNMFNKTQKIILQETAASLRENPSSVELTSPFYNTMKQFSETELVIYGPVRVGAMDRLKCSTTRQSE